MKKHSIVSHGDYSSPSKRSRPSLSERLGLADDSDQSDAEPYSPSDENLADDEQRIIRQPQASLRESTLIVTGQPPKHILELLQDDDEDDEDNAKKTRPPPTKQQRTTTDTITIQNPKNDEDEGDNSDSSSSEKLRRLALGDQPAVSSDEESLSDDDAPRGWKDKPKPRILRS